LVAIAIPSGAREPSIAKALGSLGARLEASSIGPANTRSWFGRSTVVDVVGDTITMQFPNKFTRDRVRSDYERDLLACCSALVPSIKVIRFTVAAENAA
jgi:hypothetical protein